MFDVAESSAGPKTAASAEARAFDCGLDVDPCEPCASTGEPLNSTRSSLPQRRGRLRRVTGVLSIILCQSTQVLVFGGIALFLPLIRDSLGLSFTEAGALAAVSTLVYACMQIPAGYLADRFGARKIFLVGVLGTNALTLVFTVLHSYQLLVANQALTGVFRAMVFAPGLLLIGACFAPERRATAIGLYVAGGFSGSVVLNLIGPIVVDPLGWRVVLAVGGLLGFLVLALYWTVGPEPPPRTFSGQHVTVTEIVGLFRLAGMWLIAGIQFVRLGVALGLASWLPTLIVEDKGFSLRTAGIIVGCGAAVTAPSNFIGGYISDRLHNPLLIIGVSQVVLSLTLVLLVSVEGVGRVFIVVAVISAFVQLYFGPLFAVPIDWIGPRMAGVSSGFGNFFANIGAFVMVYVLGVMKDATGTFAAGLYTLAALAAAGSLCTIMLGRIGRMQGGRLLTDRHTS